MIYASIGGELKVRRYPKDWPSPFFYLFLRAVFSLPKR